MPASFFPSPLLLLPIIIKKKFPHSFLDGVTQLESKDVILMQNVPGEKNCQWHKNGEIH